MTSYISLTLIFPEQVSFPNIFTVHLQKNFLSRLLPVFVYNTTPGDFSHRIDVNVPSVCSAASAYYPTVLMPVIYKGGIPSYVMLRRGGGDHIMCTVMCRPRGADFSGSSSGTGQGFPKWGKAGGSPYHDFVPLHHSLPPHKNFQKTIVNGIAYH